MRYAWQKYTDLLKQHHVEISMSRKGNPYDNAACESFMKTLKYEEVYRNECSDFEEANASLCEFLERVYKPETVALGSWIFAASRVRKRRRMTARDLRQARSTGALPLRPRDLSLFFRQNGDFQESSGDRLFLRLSGR
jgi:transposase InsO family protein